MGRPRKVAVEDEWFDCFSRWTKSDREAALKVLGTLHRHLPDKPGSMVRMPAAETTDPRECCPRIAQHSIPMDFKE